MTKKILSVLLCVIMLCSVFAPAALAYGTDVLPVYKTYMNLDRYEGYTETVDWNSLFVYIRQQVMNGEETVSLADYGIPVTNENLELLADFIFNNTAYIKNVNTYSLSYINSTNTIDILTVGYQFTAGETEQMAAECEDAITQLLYGIKGNDSLTDAQKCLLLHDRLATFCEYDYANYLAGTVPYISHSAYGPLVLHVGVCEGIAMAYSWMLDELGIENYYVTSDKINHGWNVVYIDDEREPYYVDVTWDDPVYDIPGRVCHENLLVSYSSFAATHKASDFSDEPDSTLYENGVWTFSESEFQYVNGKIYGLSNEVYQNASGLYKNKTDIVEIDPVTNESETVYTIFDTWFVAENSYYPGSYSYLASVGNKLLYNTSREIHSYDVTTGVDEVVYTPDLTSFDDYSNIYGFTQQGGVLYMLISTESRPNSSNPGTVITYPYCTSHSSFEVLENVSTATCTNYARQRIICKDCRLVGVVDDVNDGYADHSYTVYVAEKTSATCTSNRFDTYKCANCTATTDKEIANTKTAHAYTEFVAVKTPATCTANAIGTYKCATCTATEDREIANTTAEHSYTVYVGEKTSATCTANRVDTYKCATCTATTEKEIAGTKTQHNYTVYVAVKTPATCLANRVDTYKCATCTATTDKEIAGTTIQHSYTVYVGVKTPATCTANAIGTYKCATCTATTEKEVTDTKTAHSYTVYVSEKTPATCVVDATATYKCATCTATTEKTVANSKVPHTYSTTVTAPTCTQRGYTTYICTVCNDSYNDSYTASTGHTDGNGDGYCDNCGADIATSGCTCVCHKGGIAGFFFRLKIFFSKIFNIEKNRYCECGKAHW